MSILLKNNVSSMQIFYPFFKCITINIDVRNWHSQEFTLHPLEASKMYVILPFLKQWQVYKCKILSYFTSKKKQKKFQLSFKRTIRVRFHLKNIFDKILNKRMIFKKQTWRMIWFYISKGQKQPTWKKFWIKLTLSHVILWIMNDVFPS